MFASLPATMLRTVTAAAETVLATKTYQERTGTLTASTAGAVLAVTSNVVVVEGFMRAPYASFLEGRFHEFEQVMAAAEVTLGQELENLL